MSPRLRFRTPLLSIALAMILLACTKPLSNTELLQRASSALENPQGDLTAAEVDIKTVLQQNPENARARYLFGLLHVRSMNVEQAVEQFRRSLEAESSDEAFEELAKAMVQSGNSEDFIDEWTKGKFAPIQNSQIFAAILARAYMGQQNFAQAEDWLDLAQERVEKSEEVGNGDAGLHSIDYIDVTRAMFVGIVESDASRAFEIVDKITKRSPMYAEAWSVRGLFASSSEQLEIAAQSYAKAFEVNRFRLNDRINFVIASIQNGDNESAASELAALSRALPDAPRINYLKGRLAFSEGDYKASIEALSQVLAYAPDSSEALLLSGTANAREGNLATASRQLTQFLTKRPQHVQARLQLAQVRLNMDEAEVAEQIAREVLEESKMNVPALTVLAMALAVQGQNAESADAYEQLALLSPESVELKIAAGSQNMLAGDNDTAMELMREAVELSPQVEEAWTKLIAAVAKTGDIDEAWKLTERYLAEHDNSSTARVFAGRMSLAMDNPELAKEYFNQALSIEPKNSLAFDGLATLSMLEGDYDAARAALEKALTANPGDLPSSMGLAAIAERTGSTDEMVATLQAARDANPKALEPRLALARHALYALEFDKAIGLLSEVRDDYNDSYLLHDVLARAYISTNQRALALESASKLAELRPDDPRALGLSARVQMRAGRPEAAEAQASKVLELDSEDIGARKLLVEALVAQDKRPAAKNQIEKLPIEVREQPDTQALMGRLALADNDYSSAKSFLLNAFDEQPSTTNLMLLSAARWELGEQVQVIEMYQQWLEENPQDGVARAALATRSLDYGDVNLARASYELLVEEFPQNVVALNNLAWLKKDDDPSAALVLIRRAHDLAPESGQITDTFAVVQMENNNLEEAMELSKQALSQAPGDKEIRFHQAQILAALGRTSDAKELLEDLLGDPDFTSAAEARALSNSL